MIYSLKRNFLPIGFLSLFMLSSCSSDLDQQQLQGKWNYIKVEALKNSEENTSPEELNSAAPYIEFDKDSLRIFWDHKLLSHGSYKIDGKMLRYTEILEGAKTRTFPFLVSELTNNTLIFETMEQQSTRVTAVKGP